MFKCLKKNQKSTDTDLLKPFKLGAIQLNNRVIMAPMTRGR